MSLTLRLKIFMFLINVALGLCLYTKYYTSLEIDGEHSSQLNIHHNIYLEKIHVVINSELRDFQVGGDSGIFPKIVS